MRDNTKGTTKVPTGGRPPENETNDIMRDCIQYTTTHYNMMNSKIGEHKTRNRHIYR